jgi:hypothetical protein
MGIFDFLRKRRRGGASDVDALDELLRKEPAPRCQYYFFAHYALRSAAYQLGAAAVGVLLSPRRDEFLADMWRMATEGCKQNGDDATDPLPPVEVLPLRAGPMPCVVLRMPPPQRTTECHFVGIVLHVDASDDRPPNLETAAVSYYTLERGARVDSGAERTVLCGWSKDESHSNYGDGPPPEPQAFADAVGAIVASRPA